MTGTQFLFALLALVVSVASALIGLANFVFNLIKTSPDASLEGLLRWTSLVGIHELPPRLKDPSFYNELIDSAKKVLFVCFVAAVIAAAKFWPTADSSSGTGASVARLDPLTSPTTSQPIQATPQAAGPTILPDNEIPLSDKLVHGRLIPANDPTPTNACSAISRGNESAVLIMGNNAVTNDGFGSFIPLSISGCPAIEMTRTSEGVLFSAELVDHDYNRIVVISNNNIQSLDGENYKSRQSQDRAAFYVLNKNDRELFYARFLNKNTVVVRGFFGCAPNRILRIADNEPFAGFISHSCAGNSLVGFSIN